MSTACQSSTLPPTPAMRTSPCSEPGSQTNGTLNGAEARASNSATTTINYDPSAHGPPGLRDMSLRGMFDSVISVQPVRESLLSALGCIGVATAQALGLIDLPHDELTKFTDPLRNIFPMDQYDQVQRFMAAGNGVVIMGKDLEIYNMRIKNPLGVRIGPSNGTKYRFTIVVCRQDRFVGGEQQQLGTMIWPFGQWQARVHGEPEPPVERDDVHILDQILMNPISAGRKALLVEGECDCDDANKHGTVLSFTKIDTFSDVSVEWMPLSDGATTSEILKQKAMISGETTDKRLARCRNYAWNLLVPPCENDTRLWSIPNILLAKDAETGYSEKYIIYVNAHQDSRRLLYGESRPNINSLVPEPKLLKVACDFLEPRTTYTNMEGYPRPLDHECDIWADARTFYAHSYDKDFARKAGIRRRGMNMPIFGDVHESFELANKRLFNFAWFNINYAVVYYNPSDNLWIEDGKQAFKLNWDKFECPIPDSLAIELADRKVRGKQHGYANPPDVDWELGDGMC